jgi:arabinogalactan endo-1,4-beta-galactosidase
MVTSGWWNAALYDHNTGKPYAAFYELKNFNNSSSGFQDITKEHKCKDCSWYTIGGRRLEGEPSKSGIYVKDKQKVAFRK